MIVVNEFSSSMSKYEKYHLQRGKYIMKDQNDMGLLLPVCLKKYPTSIGDHKVQSLVANVEQKERYFPVDNVLPTPQ